MGKTVVSIQGEDFLLNGVKTYAELPFSNAASHGLLMNARFIQGIFDDAQEPSRFNRFGRIFDAEQNTSNLIHHLPQWYEYGLRAITVGLQGGGPCFTTENQTIHNNPFSPDGKTLDAKYLHRLDRLIRAADELGMVIIVSYFYPGQFSRLEDGRAIANAVRTASEFLRDKGYTNVIIEVSNEMDVNASVHPIISQPESMAVLIEIAKQSSGGLLVGCSGGGGSSFPEVSRASDVIFIHGNGCSRQVYYKLIERVRQQSPGKPVVCNEDSQAIGQLKVAFDTHSSWGYYNNMTKQEPPTDWSITTGEDLFFAYRMAMGIGIPVPEIPFEDQFYFQGLEPDMTVNHKRWLRVASLYPERIDYVKFYKNGLLYDISYDEPFNVHFMGNWIQGPVDATDGKDTWRADIYLRDGRVIVK